MLIFLAGAFLETGFLEAVTFVVEGALVAGTTFEVAVFLTLVVTLFRTGFLRLLRLEAIGAAFLEADFLRTVFLVTGFLDVGTVAFGLDGFLVAGTTFGADVFLALITTLFWTGFLTLLLFAALVAGFLDVVFFGVDFVIPQKAFL